MRVSWKFLALLFIAKENVQAQPSQRVSYNFAATDATDGGNEMPQYNSMGYPAFKDLRLRSLTREHLIDLSLDELIRLRPKNPEPWLADHYAYLFSQHPDVDCIYQTTHGVEEIAKAWSDLRESKMMADMSTCDLRSLTASIDRFVKFESHYDEETQDRVQTRWANDYYKHSPRRRKEKGIIDPRTHRRPYWRERAQGLKEERQQGTMILYETLIEQNGINVDGLDAAQIESATRSFHHKVYPARSAVSKLAKYLKARGFNEKDVDCATGTRRRYLKMLRTRRYSSKRRERQTMPKGSQHDNCHSTDGLKASDKLNNILMNASCWWAL